MEIHKPKPWHGLREFLNEYLIIVIGVLTALAAEQAVEALRVGSEVREARAAIHAEMRVDLRKLLLEQREYACYASRMAAMAAWARGDAPRPKPGVGPLFEGLSSNAWETAKTGAVPHMGLDERLALGDFYGGIDNQLSMIRLLRQQSNELAGYLDRDKLDPEEGHALARLSAQVRAYLHAESRNIPGLLSAGARLGVQPGPPVADREARIDALCAAYPPGPEGFR